VLPFIDGALIAAPNDSHGSLGLHCIRAGVATLIEKPLCTTLADAESLVAEAHKAGVTLATGYSTRFRDNTVFLKELLDTREFGTVHRFAHQFGSAGGWAPLSAYNLQRKATGGGVLVVTGTHFLDRMLYLWGYPDQSTLVDDGVNGPEANATATFRFDRGDGQIAGVARYSKTGSLPSGLVIDTEAGIVKMGDSDEAPVILFPRSNPNVAVTIRRRGKPRFDPRISPFQHQLEDFVSATRDKRDPMVDGKQGAASIRLLEELYSHRHVDARRWYRTESAA